MSSDQHSSPSKTPRQLITVVVLAFVVPVILIVLLVTFVTGEKVSGAGTESMTPEAVAERLRPVGTVVMAVQCVVDLVLGGYLINAAANCIRVVDTQGQDIPNLMAGLEQLRRYFRLQMILIIVALCSLGAGFLLAIAV